MDGSRSHDQARRIFFIQHCRFHKLHVTPGKQSSSLSSTQEKGATRQCEKQKGWLVGLFATTRAKKRDGLQVRAFF
jgi:hypothetical protein